MNREEFMEKAAQYIIDADEESVVELAKKYIEGGFDPADMVENGLSEGIKKLGDLFDRGEIFLPHLGLYYSPDGPFGNPSDLLPMEVRSKRPKKPRKGPWNTPPEI